METIHELLGYERIKIVQRRDMFSFTLDALLLADFARVKGENESVIDLGCGNAPIPLFLTLKTTGRIVGVELQEEAFRLARKSVAHNGFEDRITIINADIKDVHKTLGHNVFDIAVANPPYFRYSPESNLNKNDYLSVARHEIAITLEDIVTAAKRLLREGGSLNMIHRTERLGSWLRPCEGIISDCGGCASFIRRPILRRRFCSLPRRAPIARTMWSSSSLCMSMTTTADIRKKC